MKNKLIQLIPIFILSACATTKTTNIPFSPVTAPPDSAILYVYRPQQHSAGYRWRSSLRFFVNGEQKFDLPYNSYGYVYLKEGTHNISLIEPGSPPSEAKISVLARHKYFVKVLGTQYTSSSSSTIDILDLTVITTRTTLSPVYIELSGENLVPSEIHNTTLAIGVATTGEAIAPPNPAELSKLRDLTAEFDARNEKIKRNLETLLAGATLSWTTEDGTKFHVYSAPDGKLFGKSMTKHNTEQNDTGIWMFKDGTFCRKWDKWRDGKWGCNVITPIAGLRYSMEDFNDIENPEVKILKGDMQGLDTRVE